MAKATKPSELRAKSEDELNTLLLDLKKEQFNLRFQRAVGQVEGAGRVREVGGQGHRTVTDRRVACSFA